MKNIKLYFLIIALEIILLGCTSRPQYQEEYQDEFAEIILTENTFRIEFKGNEYLNKEEVFQCCLIRSAELALANGFQYFIIVDNQKYTDKRTYTEISSNIIKTPPNIIVNTVKSVAHSYDINTETYIHTIICFNEKPINTDNIIYTSKFILDKTRFTQYQ